MNNRTHLLYISAIALAAVCGGLLVLASQWLGAGNRPAEDTIFRLFPVKLEGLKAQDQWLLNFDVVFAPTEKVRTDSSYGLLVVLPKQNQIIKPLPTGKQQFMLNGFEGNYKKPVLIDTSYFVNNPGKPEIILLDFLQWPKISNSFIEDKTLILRPDSTN